MRLARFMELQKMRVLINFVLSGQGMWSEMCVLHKEFPMDEEIEFVKLCHLLETQVLDSYVTLLDHMRLIVSAELCLWCVWCTSARPQCA